MVGFLRLAAIIGGGGLAVAFTVAALAPRVGDIYSANQSTTAEIDLDELALRSMTATATSSMSSTTSRIVSWSISRTSATR